MSLPTGEHEQQEPIGVVRPRRLRIFILHSLALLVCGLIFDVNRSRQGLDFSLRSDLVQDRNF